MPELGNITTLQEIVAVESRVRTSAQAAISGTMIGFRDRSGYTRIGNSLPEGSSWQELQSVVDNIAPAISLTVSKALANRTAGADIVLYSGDGEEVLNIPDVPTTVLVQLKAWLSNLVGVVEKMPVLPLDGIWEFDTECQAYVQKDDGGDVTSVSRAIPGIVQSDLLSRLNTILETLQMAVVKANKAEVPQSDILPQLLTFLLEPVEKFTSQ